MSILFTIIGIIFTDGLLTPFYKSYKYGGEAYNYNSYTINALNLLFLFLIFVAYFTFVFWFKFAFMPFYREKGLQGIYDKITILLKKYNFLSKVTLQTSKRAKTANSCALTLPRFLTLFELLTGKSTLCP